MVRINITANVPNIPVVPNFVESGQHPGNQNLEAAGNVRGCSPASCKHPQSCRVSTALGNVLAFGVTIEDGVDDFAESAATKFGWQPSLLKVILDDGLVFLEQRVSQSGREWPTMLEDAAISCAIPVMPRDLHP